MYYVLKMFYGKDTGRNNFLGNILDSNLLDRKNTGYLCGIRNKDKIPAFLHNLPTNLLFICWSEQEKKGLYEDLTLAYTMCKSYFNKFISYN